MREGQIEASDADPVDGASSILVTKPGVSISTREITRLGVNVRTSATRQGSLIELRTDAARWSGSVGITRRRRGVLSPASSAFIAEIKDVAAEGVFRAHKSLAKR